MFLLKTVAMLMQRSLLAGLSFNDLKEVHDRLLFLH